MNKRTLILIILFVTLSIQIVAAKELNVFYSNENRIGHNPNRAIWSICISGFSVNEFNSFLSHGRSQWSSVGISSYGVDDNTYSGIDVYGGTRSALENLEPILEYYSAIAVFNTIPDGTHTYNGQIIDNRRIIGKSYVYVPKQPIYYFWSDNTYRSAFTHELGHVFGWLGHSNVSSDVMHADYSSITNLTDRDKMHLVQNY